MTIVRLTRLRGTVHGVPLGVDPVAELELPDGAYVVDATMHMIPPRRHDQKDRDWSWSALIAAPVREAA